MERPLPAFAKIGETPADICNNLRVFLDAVEQNGVIEADTASGYIVRYVEEKGPDGRMRFKSAGDEVLTERVEGIVELMWKTP